ncbi:hypothetical protein HK101_005455 [Irineochytrium annulatum]|nr:hypothetical protein HK101_005455 [Irineochytrium annulatum]
MPAIDKPADDASHDSDEDKVLVKTMPDLLALLQDPAYTKDEIHCISLLPEYRDAWRDLAFSYARSGHERAVHELNVACVPLTIRDDSGASLLYTAALWGQRGFISDLLKSKEARELVYDLHGPEDTRPEDESKKLLAEYKRIMHRQGRTLFTPRKTVVELTVEMWKPDLLDLLLDEDTWVPNDHTHCLKPILNRCLELVEKMLANAATTDVNYVRLREKLRTKIRQFTVMNLWRAGVLAADERAFYFPIPTNLAERPWTDEEKNFLRINAGRLARSVEHREALEWVLNEWGVDRLADLVDLPEEKLIPMSVADEVILGYRGVWKVEKLMDLLDGAKPDNRLHGRAFFEDVVSAKWDGDPASLVATFREAYVTSCDNIDEMGGDGWKSNPHAALLSDEGWEERLDTIKLLMTSIDTIKYGCIPRLDVLTIAGEINILRWLIANNHLNLSELVYPDRTAVAMRDDDEETEDSVDIEELEDGCAVCYREKRDPQTMECSHSFCRGCVKRIYDFAHRRPATCPYCRADFPPRPVDLAPAAVLARSLEIAYSGQNLIYAPDRATATIGEVLFIIASFEGNVAVVSWLVGECGVDPIRTRTMGGLTAMHNACRRGRLAVCRWMYERYPSIFDIPASPEDPTTAFDYLFRSRDGHTLGVIKYFASKTWLPNDWCEKAMGSTSEIVEYARQVATEPVLDMMPTALLANAMMPLSRVVAKLVTCLETPPASVIGDLIHLYKVAVLVGRYDVLYWICREREEWWKGMRPLLHLKWRTGMISDEQAFANFLFVIEVAWKTRMNLNMVIDTISDAVEFGVGVEVHSIKICLDYVLTTMDGMPPKLKPNWFTAFKKRCPEVLLSLAFKHGHRHLIEWSLELDGAASRWTSSTAVFKALSVWECPNAETMGVLLGWIRGKGMEVESKVVKAGLSGEVEYSNVIDLFAGLHYDALTATGTIDRAAIERYGDVLKFVCAQSDIKRLHDGLSQDRYYEMLSGLGRIAKDIALDAENFVFISDHLANYFRALLTDVDSADASWKEWTVRLAEHAVTAMMTAGPVCLEAVRYLALEKGVSVIYRNINGWGEVDKSVAAAFKTIQETQRAARAG